MSKKHLLTISLLLPLVAISATTYAGETITSKSYWPNEARHSAYGVTAQSDPRSAFAYFAMTPRFQAAPMADESRHVQRHHDTKSQ